ncbi:LPS export ABC transporter periplasmic protein LptC [Aeromonas schubertii]|uniref:Lipopolysaccharide export system protein LptC n=1 Tax=Aeromonas schubertii TaxID=652 RepID=A0ABS7V7S1_9GAMM|nr:LPS export ABC transporter periplasmic protein LptC [Aeromonas schubertii]MBZ6065393.1 LPS export ABC transporter periplasmic protein LptC [Aeromonas schubertii]MBZ6072349.1 LPS export ABC transporter periplasmic protein LptC [Aeromonas schubertii]QCG49250.1 LPS export ABC transporter periplasmic protein LptC [Aeromonas schubertii]
MNRQTLLFGVLFIVALACWQVLNKPVATVEPTQKEHFQPDFVARDMVTLQYDEEGRLQDRLESVYAEYFRAIEMVNMTQPIFYRYDEQGRPEWRLTAEEGVLNVGDNAILRRKVQVDGLLEEGPVKRLDTEYMELDLNNQDIRSNQEVKMLGKDLQTEGLGLRGNLDKRYFELLEQSHAIYFNEKR